MYDLSKSLPSRLKNTISFFSRNKADVVSAVGFLVKASDTLSITITRLGLSEDFSVSCVTSASSAREVQKSLSALLPTLPIHRQEPSSGSE